MDVKTDSDLHSEAISRNTRAGGLENAVIYRGIIVRYVPVLGTFFANFRHDDSGAHI